MNRATTGGKAKYSSAKTELARLRSECDARDSDRNAREICESLALDATPTQLKAIAGLPDFRDRIKLAKQLKAAKAQPKKGVQPRRSTSQDFLESRAKQAAAKQAFAKCILGTVVPRTDRQAFTESIMP